MVHYAPTPQGCHPGVGCDKSGQYPIVGWRFKLKGSDPSYDLCEAEFDKLPDAEKANYEKIAPPPVARVVISSALVDVPTAPYLDKREGLLMVTLVPHPHPQPFCRPLSWRRTGATSPPLSTFWRREGALRPQTG